MLNNEVVPNFKKIKESHSCAVPVSSLYVKIETG